MGEVPVTLAMERARRRNPFKLSCEFAKTPFPLLSSVYIWGGGQNSKQNFASERRFSEQNFLKRLAGCRGGARNTRCLWPYPKCSCALVPGVFVFCLQRTSGAVRCLPRCGQFLGSRFSPRRAFRCLRPVHWPMAHGLPAVCGSVSENCFS